jgi:hypothetical protein
MTREEAIAAGMEVAGEQCQVVGNRFLLNIPDKVAVIVHRRYTDEENARLREEWLSCGLGLNGLLRCETRYTFFAIVKNAFLPFAFLPFCLFYSLAARVYSPLLTA